MRRLVLPLLVLAPATLAAQIPNSSVRALGLGGSYTAIARGYEAGAWNPAVLGLRRNPGFTLNLAMGSVEFGSTDLGFGDFRKYADTFLSQQDKNDILAKIDTALGMRTQLATNFLSLSIGRFALSLSAAGDMDARLGKDAVDLALNGNAANPSRIFTAAGSRARGWAASTAAISYGMPLVTTPLGRITVGATAKKIWGQGLGRANETSSSFRVNPTFLVNAAGHAIYTDFDTDNYNFFDAAGSGFGVDVGGVLEMPGGLTIGASLVNVVHSMSWDASRLRYDRVVYSVTQTSGGQTLDTEVDSTLVGSAIDADAVARAYRDSLLDDANFARIARIGAAVRLGKLQLAADGAFRLSDGLDHPPGQYVSAGAEYVLLGFLPLRAGIGTDFAKQFTFSGGSGLYLGPVHLEISAANITGSNNPGVRVGAGLGLVF